MTDFVHLHLHSEYSLLDGACRIKDIPRIVKDNSHKAVAITDHGVMYGVVAFYQACKNEGIKPIIGCEVYVSPRTRFDKTHEIDAKNYHLVLLVKDGVGYRNLIYMLSKSFTEGFYYKPRIDMELLASHSDGLIALSSCLGGKIPQCIIGGEYEAAESYALQLYQIFKGNNFYLELQNHGLDMQAEVIEGLLKISSKYAIPVVATNDVHYLKREDADKQAILMCLQTNNVISDGRPIGFQKDEFYYKSTDEMVALFGKYTEAISNTVTISNMCNFDFDFTKLYLPKFIPDNGLPPNLYLRTLAYEGIQTRLRKEHILYTEDHPEQEYMTRVEYELSVIASMGYSEYYLIVWDFVRYAKLHEIPTGPGRGSGAGSIVAFLLEITDIDSIKYNLLFERFLNPERVSMPDFDIDFCYERRDEVIEYVKEKFGHDHVSQIITFGTMAARAAVRDVGRVLGMSYSDVDIVAKLIPQKLGITLEEALAIPELKNMYDGSDRVKKLLDIAVSLEGMPRHASTHAAGVVITDKPVCAYVPLSKNNDVVVTQYDMDTVAKLGVLKFDFLALRYLTIISDAEKQIKSIEPNFDIYKIPIDDKESYDLVTSGYTEGVFQLESSGIRQMLMLLKPENIEDIIAAIALYRPGPMESIPKYIENRQEISKIVYKIPLLKDILDVTYGCILYQEQVMQIFRTVAGYQYGQADIVRRAMSKKKTDEMENERKNFILGATEKGVSSEIADLLFDDMLSFAKYAFNKSHAVSYAILSFRTAYLKSHYPKQYLSSLLTSVFGNDSKIAVYVAECNRYNIKVLPPNINESQMNFYVCGDNIRFGLLSLKNLGEGFVKNLIDERKKSQFLSFENFINRMIPYDLNKRQIETLIKCGAFDGFGIYRSRLLASYEKLVDSIIDRNRKNISGQIDLFSPDIAAEDTSISEKNTFLYADIPEFSFKQILLFEKESSGLYFSGSMFDEYKNEAEKLKVTRINLEEFVDKQNVLIAGIITKRIIKNTKSGDVMAFIIVEDSYSEIEVIVFPNILKKYEQYLQLDRAIAVNGEISIREEEVPKIVAKSVLLLKSNTNSEKTPKEEKLYLRVDNMESENFKKVYNLLEIFGGQTSVVFYDTSTKKYIKSNGVKADTSDFILNEYKKILGNNNVIFI